MSHFKFYSAGSIQAVKIFQTKKTKLDNISVDYDCHDDNEKGDVPDYIRVDKNLKNIDIMLLDQAYKPQGKYLRYVKTNSAYQYSGVVK